MLDERNPAPPGMYKTPAQSFCLWKCFTCPEPQSWTYWIWPFFGQKSTHEGYWRMGSAIFIRPGSVSERISFNPTPPPRSLRYPLNLPLIRPAIKPLFLGGGGWPAIITTFDFKRICFLHCFFQAHCCSDLGSSCDHLFQFQADVGGNDWRKGISSLSSQLRIPFFVVLFCNVCNAYSKQGLYSLEWGRIEVLFWQCCFFFWLGMGTAAAKNWSNSTGNVWFMN